MIKQSRSNGTFSRYYCTFGCFSDFSSIFEEQYMVAAAKPPEMYIEQSLDFLAVQISI